MDAQGPAGLDPAARSAEIRSASDHARRVAVTGALEHDRERVARRLRVALPGPSIQLVGEAEPADLTIVVFAAGGLLASLEQVAELGARGRVLALGPGVLSTRTLRAGAVGFVPDGTEAELPEAVQTCLAGRRYLGSSLVDGYLADGLAAAAAVGSLSARELDVLCRAGRAEAPADTAEALGVAPEAVTQYRLRARAKLGLGSTADLTAYALRHGLS